MLRFLAVIVTWFHGAGGLPRHLSALARNDSKYSTNTNLLLCFLFVPKGHLNCQLLIVNSFRKHFFISFIPSVSI